VWVVRINAAARANGLSYGQFMSGLKAAGVGLDRKSLAELAVNHPAAFTQLAQQAQGARAAHA
jgi:large subunit ribosomal protein L20